MELKMRVYRIAAVLAGAGLLMLASAAWITHRQPVPGPEPPALPEAADRGGDVWGAGYFPNVELVTHEGETVRFFDDLIEGKVVAVNFIYTTCPDSCPMETARLLEVHRLLGDRMGEDVHFYSITIDPENDTPEVLARYVESWGIPEGWTFLTGDEADIVRLRRKLGLYIEDIQSDDSNDHNLNLVIGNQATGRWMKRSPFENPYILAEQLGGWLHGWKLPRRTDRPYEEAPELRTISSGEDLFRTRCAACHTIGGGDLDDVAARRVGPDLLHVTRQRDRAWLERWLAEPDVMLEEGDPLATALKERYNDVPMPNLRLTPVDVRDLIAYMEGESERIGALLAEQAEARRLHAERTAAAVREDAPPEPAHEEHGMHGDDHEMHGEHGMHGGR